MKSPRTIVHVAVGTFVLQANIKEELNPYRSLDGSHLTIAGAWDCRDYLEDLLYLLFVEPRTNRFDIEVPPKFVPQM